MTTTTRRRLAGTLAVALPPEQAFALFTPRGEQEWAPEWEPHFPARSDDDTEPGTVFQTHGHGGEPTTWLVLDRTMGSRIRYARVIAHRNAGTVTVTLADSEGHSDVTVVYELTALSDAGQHHLDDFAAGFPAYLRGWQEAIEAALRARI